MHKIVFRIEPVPASRPRVQRYSTHYSKRYQQFREDMSVLLMGYRGEKYDGAVHLDVTFYRQIPKSYSKKKREEMHLQYISVVPDLDNLEKALYDSLNDVVFEDDALIASHNVKKLWTKEEGYIELTITRL